MSERSVPSWVWTSQASRILFPQWIDSNAIFTMDWFRCMLQMCQRDLGLLHNIYYVITRVNVLSSYKTHDDVIKWKHFPRYWPFVWGIHRSPVTRSFDVCFDLRLNKRFSKQSWGWWLETPLWRHCNVLRPLQNALWYSSLPWSWFSIKYYMAIYTSTWLPPTIFYGM